jgi:hypothetical protein
VKFRPGSPSTLGEKVASGLVWRFDTFDYVSNNLASFEDDFGDRGSFLDVSSHRFYIPKPFLEEVTDMLDPLYDAGSSCSKSSDLGPMVKVLALEEEGGGGPSCTAHLLLERPPLPEQDPPPIERDILESAIMDLHAPLDLTTDPAKIVEDLEQARLAVLDKAIGTEDTHRRMISVLCEYNTVQGYTLSGDGPSRAGQVCHRGRDLGTELNRAASLVRSPPVITKPTHSMRTKNLRAARYISSELVGLQGEELREKQARL